MELRDTLVCPECGSPYLEATVMCRALVNNRFKWEIDYYTPEHLTELITGHDHPVYCPKCEWEGIISETGRLQFPEMLLDGEEGPTMINRCMDISHDGSTSEPLYFPVGTVFVDNTGMTSTIVHTVTLRVPTELYTFDNQYKGQIPHLTGYVLIQDPTVFPHGSYIFQTARKISYLITVGQLYLKPMATDTVVEPIQYTEEDEE